MPKCIFCNEEAEAVVTNIKENNIYKVGPIVMIFKYKFFAAPVCEVCGIMCHAPDRTALVTGLSN